jgi:hypothetical protein
VRLRIHRVGRRPVGDLRQRGQQPRWLDGGDAASTPIRIVSANTLGAALRQPEHGTRAERTFRFRHTGKPAGQVCRGTTGARHDHQLSEGVQGAGRPGSRSSRSASARWSEACCGTFGRSTTRTWWLGRARTAAGRSSACSASSAAEGPLVTPPANSPGSKRTAFNAIAELLDYGRRYTGRTNQVQRSFEDTALKQRAIGLVIAA